MSAAKQYRKFFKEGKYGLPGLPSEERCNCVIEEELKTCGRCIHDEESADIVGSSCYLCKRNPTDNRIDWFEEKKGLKKNERCNNR